jgi:hypothetical protein
MRRNWLSGSWSVSPPFASGSRRAATATSPTTGEKTREIATRVRKRPRRARPPPRGKPTLPGYRLSGLSKRVFEPNGRLRPSPRPRGDPLSARRADLPLHAPRPRIVVTTFFSTSSRATRFARRRAPQSGPNDAKIHTYGRTGLRPAFGAQQNAAGDAQRASRGVRSARSRRRQARGATSRRRSARAEHERRQCRPALSQHPTHAARGTRRPQPLRQRPPARPQPPPRATHPRPRPEPHHPALLAKPDTV